MNLFHRNLGEISFYFQGYFTLLQPMWFCGVLGCFIYLFIYFWLCWVFVAAHGLSLVAVSRGYSSVRCVGFSLRWFLFVAEHGL